MALRTSTGVYLALHSAHPFRRLADAVQPKEVQMALRSPTKFRRCAPIQEASRRCTTLQKFKWRCAPLQKVYWRWHTFRRSTTHFKDFLLFD
jgi:hypothetical protein